MGTATVAVARQAEARDRADRIRESVDKVWELLYEAYVAEDHLALGYNSWSTYVTTEFGVSRGQAYRLLNQGHVIKELAAAAKLPAAKAPPVSARQAAKLAPRLDKVAEAVREETKGQRPAQRAQTAAEVIDAASRDKDDAAKLAAAFPDAATNGAAPSKPSAAKKAAAPKPPPPPVAPDRAKQVWDNLPRFMRARPGEVADYAKGVVTRSELLETAQKLNDWSQRFLFAAKGFAEDGSVKGRRDVEPMFKK